MSLYHRSRPRKRLFGWQQSLKRPAFSLPSLVKSQKPNQRINTVQFQNQFNLLFYGIKSLFQRPPSKSVKIQTSVQRMKTIHCPKVFLTIDGNLSCAWIHLCPPSKQLHQEWIPFWITDGNVKVVSEIFLFTMKLNTMHLKWTTKHPSHQSLFYLLQLVIGFHSKAVIN